MDRAHRERGAASRIVAPFMIVLDGWTLDMSNGVPRSP